MKLFLSRYGGAMILSALICGVLCAAAIWARPIFPIDETRYMTVAWEMKQSGNYLVPSLNQEVYHHKPPVLFWLINLIWAVFGVSQSAAMAIPYLASFGLLMATARLARRLFPQHPDAPLLAVAVLGGSLPFVIYANLIMFDVLLSVPVVLGITAIWDFVKWDSGKSGRSIHILILGAAIGIGILTKGPVMLLHVAFVLLGIKFWHNAGGQGQEERTEDTTEDAAPRAYFKSFAAALVLGVLMALCWAIPAAIYGGKEFADKIFWGQTAGRVVNAFDHQRPFYWYLTFVPIFVLPWALSPALWRGARNFFASTNPQDGVVKKFLLIWIIPVFAAFSMISGKQIHYLVPLLPALALLMTGCFLQVSRRLGGLDIWAILAVVAVLCAVPIIMNFYADRIGAMIHGSVHIEETFAKSNPLTPMAVMMVIIVCGLAAGYLAKSQLSLEKSVSFPLALMALCMAVMMAGFMMAAKNGFLINYDLAPIAAKLKEFDHRGISPSQENSQENIGFRPIAAAQVYHGEFGFLARLDQSVEQIRAEEIATWLAQHPHGLVVYRTKDLKNYAPYHILYQQPYALSGYYAILEQSASSP